MKDGGFDYLKITHTTNLKFSHGYYKDLDHIFYDKRIIPNSAAGCPFFYSIIFFALNVNPSFRCFCCTFVFAGLEEALGNSCKDVSFKNYTKLLGQREC